jgi:HK97 family phage portal protein
MSPGAVRGLSPVLHMAETLGLAAAAQNYGSSWFGQGAVPAGVIESDAPEPTPEQIQSIKANWLRSNGGTRRASLGVLYGGAKYKPITLAPEAAQFLGTRSFSAAEIAAAYHVDPAWVGVGVQGSSLTYQNVGDQYLALIRRALMAPMRILEERLSALMPPAQRMRFVPDVYMKPDTAGRYAAYQMALSAGFMTVDEVRALEDLPPLADAASEDNDANDDDTD